jgi:hypothetical protein
LILIWILGAKIAGWPEVTSFVELPILAETLAGIHLWPVICNLVGQFCGA